MNEQEKMWVDQAMAGDHAAFSQLVTAYRIHLR